MKRHATMKYISAIYKNVYNTGYCDLHDIMSWLEPVYYNSGVYGWNNDTYVNYKYDIAISTGYRNMRGSKVPRSIIDKYSRIAADIKQNYNNHFDYNRTMAELDENRNNFYLEILAL